MGAPAGKIHHRSVSERQVGTIAPRRLRRPSGDGRGKVTCSPRDPAAPAASSGSSPFSRLSSIVSGLGSAFLPSVDRVALAQDGQALGDTLILAGPGGQYGILTVAPAGAVMSVDGDPVDGYYPVTYDGISGWTATGLLQVAETAAMAAAVATAAVAATTAAPRMGSATAAWRR